MRNKFNSLCLMAGLIALVAALLVPAKARASDVYNRTVITNTATSFIWTNTARYVALDLKRVWVERSLVATDTGTVKRITADGLYTQAVCTVAIASGIGNTNSFVAEYFSVGDKLSYAASSAGSAATGSTFIIDGVYQNP